MRHILLIHQFYLPAGAAGGSRWNETAERWVTEGYRVTVIAGMVDYMTGRKFAHCRNRFFVEETPLSGLRVIRTHVSERYNQGWFGRFWGYVTFLLSGGWAALFRARDHYDVVIVTSPPLLIGLLGVAIAKQRRLPLVLEIRDLWPDVPVQLGVLTNPVLIRLAYWLEGFLYRQAQHIVLLTEGYRAVLLRSKNVERTRMSVIPNAADLTLTDEVALTFDRALFRRRHRMSEGLWVVYAGAHGLVNRLQTVLEAADQLRHAHVRFLLIGDGREKKHLQAVADCCELTNVRFMDTLPKTKLIPFLLAADIGLTTAPNLPVFRTVLTNKLFDYFACRLPVLTMLDGESRLLIETANAGIYVEPENADALVNAVLRYAEAPELARQHGENGYRYAQQYADRDVLARRYLTLIQDVSTRWQTNA